MCSDFRKFRYVVGTLGPGFLTWMLALTALPAHAGPQGMPLVLPTQSLPLVCQMNQATNFTVFRASQIPIGNTGLVQQTSLVDVVPQQQQVHPGQSCSLFLLAGDVPHVQQLNQGANVRVTHVFPAPLGPSGPVAQVAQVNITQADNRLNGVRPTDFWLVCPTRMLPVLAELNEDTKFTTVRVSRVAPGNGGPVQQTALVACHQPEIMDETEPVLLFVRRSDLPTLAQCNIGVQMEIVDVFEQVAFVELMPNQQVLQQLNQARQHPPR